MGFFADTQETAKRFGRYIAEFEELYRANGISFGTSEDFFRLAPRLARDESFREEFTALTRSAQKREDGRLALTGMLSIVARAAGGEGIGKVGEEGTVPASLLVVFLAGLGGWNEAEAVPTSAAKDAPANNGSVSERAAGLHSRDDDQAASDLEQRLTAGPEEDVGVLATTLFGGPAQVKEALGRLERNTLQMKMHLDSIDSRIERIEPHLDELKSRTAIPAEELHQDEERQEKDQLTVPVPPMKPWPTPDEESPRPEWTESAPAMRPWPAEKEQDLMWKPAADVNSAPTRANWPVKEAEPVWRGPIEARRQPSESPMRARSLAEGAAPLRTTTLDEEEDLPIRVPFEESLYEEERSGWARGLASILAVALIALGVWGWVFYRHHGWHGYHNAVHAIAAEIAHTKAMVSKSGQPAGSPSTAQNATHEAAGATLQQPPPPPPAQNPSTTTAPAQPAAATASQAAPKQNQPAAAKEDAAASGAEAGSTESAHPHPAKNAVQPIVSVLAGSGVAPKDVSDTKLPPGMHSAVPVFVDLSRLSPVADPMPEYPHDALSRGIAGDVVVEADIARNGEVESAEIVSGPAGLLKSSLDAVRQWRFTPYRDNGQPVEARTYVRFRYRTERLNTD